MTCRPRSLRACHTAVTWQLELAHGPDGGPGGDRVDERRTIRARHAGALRLGELRDRLIDFSMVMPGVVRTELTSGVGEQAGCQRRLGAGGEE